MTGYNLVMRYGVPSTHSATLRASFFRSGQVFVRSGQGCVLCESRGTCDIGIYEYAKEYTTYFGFIGIGKTGIGY